MQEAVDYLSQHPEDTAWINEFLNKRRNMYFDEYMRKFDSTTGYVRDIVERLRKWMKDNEACVKYPEEHRTFAADELRNLSGKRFINLLHYEINYHIAKKLIGELTYLCNSPSIYDQGVKERMRECTNQLVDQIDKCPECTVNKANEVVAYHIEHCEAIDSLHRYDNDSFKHIKEIEVAIVSMQKRKKELMRSIVDRRVALTSTMVGTSGLIFSHLPEYD